MKSIPAIIRPKIAVRTGMHAVWLTVVLGFMTNLILYLSGQAVLTWYVFTWVIAIVAIVSGVFHGFYVEYLVGRRIQRVRRELERQADKPGLKRLPDLGKDEMGDVARSINNMLANMTELEVQMLEQDQELQHTRKELELKQALAAKSEELEQRLEERAMLFDILRVSASEHELDTVLSELVRRFGSALKLRECALGLCDDQAERIIIKAHYGFPEDTPISDRIVLYHEGPIGDVARTRSPLIIDNLSDWDGPPILWNVIPRRGTIAIFPVLHRGEAIGVIATTRDQEKAFPEPQIRLLRAIADQLGLAIRHAQLFDELRRGSNQDDLTGLGNRRLLRARLQDEMHRAQRFRTPVSLLALDIDHFKVLNDRSGHPTGDASLRKLAGLMTRNLRRIDTIARTGGEEFVVLLPQIDHDDAIKVAEKLRALVETTDFPGADAQPEGCLTVSIGVATLQQGEAAESFLARSDAALYGAKAAGRNRVMSADYAVEVVRSRTSSRI